MVLLTFIEVGPARIYSLHLQKSATRIYVSDSWVSRDPEVYKNTDIEFDRQSIRRLIDDLLLNRPADSLNREQQE